jgi:hypothetical protein
MDTNKTIKIKINFSKNDKKEKQNEIATAETGRINLEDIMEKEEIVDKFPEIVFHVRLSERHILKKK